MATKKQKHQAAMERREKFLAEVKADGLKALQFDRERREGKKHEAKIDEETRIKRENITKAINEMLVESFAKLEEAAHRATDSTLDLTRITA